MTTHTRPCDCCSPSEPLIMPANRPGLTRLEYRFADYGSFLRRMQARLHRFPADVSGEGIQHPLAGFTTRSIDDPMIAVLDAAAVVADILTFYQERIANEGYLGTATERRSVLELARAIGYELHPGAAASAHLSFMLDDSGPHTTTIATGTQVDSMPAAGGLPQTFETTTSLEARSAWNAISPLMTLPQTIAVVDGEVRLFSKDPIFSGDGVTLVSSESVRVVSGPELPGQVWTKPLEVLRLDGAGLDIDKGDRLLFLGRRGSLSEAAVLRAEDVRKDGEAGNTIVYLKAGGEAVTVSLPVAPTPAQTPPAVTPELDRTSARNWIRDRRWRDPDLRSFITAAGWDEQALTRHLATEDVAEETTDRGVYAFATRVSAFGHNAPLHSSLPVVTATAGINIQFRGGQDPFTQSWDTGGGWRIDRRYPEGTTWPNGGIRLARVVPDIAVGSWAVLEERHSTGHRVEVRKITKVWEESVTAFSLSGEVTALGLAPSITSSFSPRIRTTSVYVGSRRLPLATLPMDSVLAHPVSGGADTIVLQGLYLGMRDRQPIAVEGTDSDLSGVKRHEVVTIDRIEHHNGRTVLFLETALRHRYQRSSVRINANTIQANHGTTGTEVIGSGQATYHHQRFDLTRTSIDRLTHVSAATPSGIEPSLAVRVNGVLWKRVDALFGHGPSDQVYEVRIGDEGKATVRFGDGVTGSRLPTGTDNVSATYRVGTGSKGEVGPGALQLLPARPEWVGSVTNPEGASGAQDPERLEEGRRNAPLTVRTLDRVVSVSDYQDFARSYAGIGKARADRVWDGKGELIVVTVGSATGSPLETTSASVRALTEAIEKYRDPVRMVRVVPLAERTFDVSAKVVIDDRFQSEDVLTEIADRLWGSFSYDQSEIAEDVTKSSILTAIHSVHGVVAVDLDLFAPSGVAEVASVVESLAARWSAEAIQPAQLLVLNPAGLSLTSLAP